MPCPEFQAVVHKEGRRRRKYLNHGGSLMRFFVHGFLCWRSSQRLRIFDWCESCKDDGSTNRCKGPLAKVGVESLHVLHGARNLCGKSSLPLQNPGEESLSQQRLRSSQHCYVGNVVCELREVLAKSTGSQANHSENMFRFLSPGLSMRNKTRLVAAIHGMRSSFLLTWKGIREKPKKKKMHHRNLSYSNYVLLSVSVLFLADRCISGTTPTPAESSLPRIRSSSAGGGSRSFKLGRIR